MKKTTKILSLLLAFILSFGFMPFSNLEAVTYEVSAIATTSTEDFVFDANTATITSYKGTMTDVVIPDSINGVTVKSIGPNAFKYTTRNGMTLISSVQLNPSLEKIDAGAFGAQKNLKSVIFNSALKRIEKMAFVNCGITEANLNEGLEYIGQYVFSNCKSLVTVKLPYSLTSIDSLAFQNCTQLTGNLILGPNMGHVSHQIFKGEMDNDITLSIAEGESKLYLHDQLFTSVQNSIKVPTGREVMIFARAADYQKDFIIDCGTVTVKDDMTPDDVLSIIKNAAKVTSGFAITDTSVSDASSDTYVEAQIDWDLSALNLSNSEITIHGEFKKFTPDQFKSVADEPVTNTAMSYLKPVIKLLVEKAPVEAFNSDDFTYGEIIEKQVNKNSYFGITGFTDSGLEKLKKNKNLTIPNKAIVKENGKDVEVAIEGIGEHAFANAGIESVTFAEPLLTDQYIIDTDAFGNNSIKSLKIPSGVKIIEASAFVNNKLVEIFIPETVTKVGSEAFKSNEISTLTISDDVINLQFDNYSFADNNIKSVNLPYSLYKAREYVFMNNPGMEPIAGSNYGTVYLYTRNADHLSASTYIFSSNYQKLILVENSTERAELYKLIKQAESLNADDYTEASFESLVSTLELVKDVFSDNEASKTKLISSIDALSKALNELVSLGLNKKDLIDAVNRLSTFNPELYTKDSYLALTESIAKANEVLKNSEAVQDDIDRALTELLNTEKNLKIKPEYIFTDTDFTYNESEVTGFSESGKIKFEVNKDVIIPSISPEGTIITSIGQSAFEMPMDKVIYSSNGVKSPYGMKSVTLPMNLKEIKDNAFRLNNLSTVIFPDNLSYIGNSAFNGNQLIEVIIPDSVKDMGEGVFALNNPLVNVKLSNSMTYIPAGTFGRCMSLENVDIPDVVTEIRQSAFIGCSVKNLKLPANLETVGKMAFQASRLETLTLPSNTKVLESKAFEQNPKWRRLKEVNLNEGLEIIKANAFKGCLIERANLPFSLKELDVNAFYDNMNQNKESIVVKLFTGNKEHLNFAESKYHEIIYRDIVSIENPMSIEVEFASDISSLLPETIKVTLSGGTVTDMKVNFNTENLDTSKPGEYTIIGELVTEGEGTDNSKAIKAELKVTVKEKPAPEIIVLRDKETGITVTGDTESLEENWTIKVVKSDRVFKGYRTQAYDITLLKDGVPVQAKKEVTLTIPAEAEMDIEKIQAFTLVDEKMVFIPSSINERKVSFKVNHFSLYGLAVAENNEVSGTTIQENKETGSLPYTGEGSNNLFNYGLLLIATAAIIGSIKKSDKKFK